MLEHPVKLDFQKRCDGDGGQHSGKSSDRAAADESGDNEKGTNGEIMDPPNRMP